MIFQSSAVMKRMHDEASACEWCGDHDTLECHHIKARGIGGGSRLDVPLNLVMLCNTCHREAQIARISASSLVAIAGIRELNRLTRMPKEAAERFAEIMESLEKLISSVSQMLPHVAAKAREWLARNAK
jgi:hypothetical protein